MPFRHLHLSCSRWYHLCIYRCDANLSNEFFDGRIHFIDKRFRVETHEKDHYQQRNHDSYFSSVKIQQFLVFWVVQFSEHDTLEDPEHVDGRKDNTACCNNCPPAQLTFKSAKKNEELTYEAVSTRQTNR